MSSCIRAKLIVLSALAGASASLVAGTPPPALAATSGAPRTITLVSGNGGYIDPDPNTQLQLVPGGPTDANGRATCGATADLVPIVLANGYDARFGGDVVYEASSASAGLAG